MAAIKFVYFDVGGVLLNWKNAMRLLAVEVNRPFEQVFEVFKKYDDEACRGTISPVQLLQLYRKDLAVAINIDDFGEWFADHFAPIKETHDLLVEVAQHYPVGLLTNIYEGSFEKVIAKGHVPNVDYATIIKSCDLRLIKPEKAFLLHAQEKAGVAPEEILFIDDYEINANAAKELGWQTVLFDEENLEDSVSRIRKALRLNLTT